MTVKRFNFVKNEDCVEDTLMSICYDVDSYRFDSKLVELLNELHEDLIECETENIRNKLVLRDIVEDLEKQAESKEPIIIEKEYVEWIKQNTVLGFAKEGFESQLKSIIDKILEETDYKR